MLLRQRKNDYRQAAHSDQGAGGIFDTNLPDVGGSSYVQRPRRSRDFAGGDSSPDMVYGDIESQATLPGPIHAQVRRHAPQRFRKGGRCASMHDALRLHGALVYGHRAAQEIRADLRIRDTKMRGQRTGSHFCECIQIGLAEPDGRRSMRL